mgnify:CR=1 FL=1
MNASNQTCSQGHNMRGQGQHLRGQGQGQDLRGQGQGLDLRGQGQGHNMRGQGQGLIDLRSQGQKHTFEADIFTSYMYTQCICRTLYMQVDPQLSTVLTKAKKANIMSSFKVNASLPESQGQDLGGQGQGLRGQGQGQANLASRPRPWPRGLHLWVLPITNESGRVTEHCSVPLL